MNNVADHVSSEASLAVTLDPKRCQFSFADGRRCRSPRWEAHPALCIAHAREQDGASSLSDWQSQKTGPYVQPARKKAAPHLEPAEMIDLAPLSGEFRTATDVNRALSRLFSLLAQNRIPRRNAVALGYLAQLLLQTLPGVREEIIDCLDYEGWDKTLKSVFGKAKAQDQTEAQATKEDETEVEAESKAAPAPEIEVRAEHKAAAAAAEAKPQDHREASVIESAHAEAASEGQPPIDHPSIDHNGAAPALTPAEIFAQVQAEIFTGRGSSPRPGTTGRNLSGLNSYAKHATNPCSGCGLYLQPTQ